ncbi:MAG TPA: hypothetical protein VHA57_01405 [Actinomycetota bacterium]|nr:hypothetical protein [Actinomycetota bacterium]
MDADDHERLARQLAFDRRQRLQGVLAVDAGEGPEVVEDKSPRQVVGGQRALDIQPDGAGGRGRSVDGDVVASWGGMDAGGMDAGGMDATTPGLLNPASS